MRAALLRRLPGSVRGLSSGVGTAPICLTWGEGTEGQLGHFPFVTSGVMQQYVELSPRQLEGLVLRSISCGTNHTLAVDGDGQVWSWGKSDYGKCGHGDDVECKEPKVVDALRGVDVATVACGESHSVALDTAGRVYAWGWGGSWISGGGQLGLGDRDHRYAPELVEGAIASARVASVSCGEGHSVFLTDDGEVWTCGAGEHGRNGNGGSGDVLAPEPVLALEDVDVVQLEAGSAFTVTLDAEGVVRVWGRNDQGQLGLGGGLAMDVYALEDLPTEITLPATDDVLKATHVAAGHSHAAVVTPEGRLLQWGAKNALEPAEHVFFPEDDGDDDAFAPPTVAKVFCGGAYTFAASTQGDVYSFGQGSSKCLGHGDKARHPHPKKVAALDGFELHELSCGFRHVAALGTWGDAVASQK